MIRFFSFLIFLGNCYFAVAQTDIYNKDATKKYAQYLWNSGDYKNAASEYERLLILDSANYNQNAVKVLQCYRKANELKTGFKRFNMLFPNTTLLSPNLNKEFALYLTGLSFYKDALAFTEQAAFDSDADKNLIMAINHAYLNEWDLAASFKKQIEEEPIAKEALNAALNLAKHSKHKKPGLAAGLSFIPGLGRLYTGNYVDAGLSILTIGTLAWQSYTGFDKNGTQSVYGWFTGGLATGFYFGNIYGSYRAAQLYNKQKAEAILNEIDRAYSLID